MELNTAQEIEQFSQKNTYTPEEKKYIMEKLNSERLLEQKKVPEVHDYKKYTSEDKNNILRKLNDKRLEEQLYKEIEKRRLHNKKKYRFDVREFYKFLHMDREYFIELKDLELLSAKPQILTLYYRTFGEIKKKDFLVKTEVYSDKIFISNDVLRVYFKGYSLEHER